MKRTLPFALFIIGSYFSFCQVSQNSLHFDGSNDYVQTTCPGISGSGARTLEAWIKTTASSTGSGGQKVILDYGSMTVGTRFTLNLLTSNAPRIEIGGSGLSSKTAVNDGNWHHIAAVYNPTATKKFILYIDGVFDTSANLSTTINSSSVNNLMIGRRNDNINYFIGNIDEIRVWNQARSASQILSLYNKEICSNQTGLIAYYRSNQGTANGSNSSTNTLTDNSSNTYTGTLNNFGLSGSSSNWTNGANITLAPNSDTTFTVEKCGFYVTPGGQNIFSSQTITETIPNAVGCDSIITINISIKQSTNEYITETRCDSFRTALGLLKTQSEIYWETFTNIHECDSNVRTLLTINHSKLDTQNVSACGSYMSPSGKHMWTVDGNYYDTLLTSHSCDSIIYTVLDILESTSVSIVVSSCNQYLSPSNKLYTESGTYIDTISNQANCDSIITISLTILNNNDTLIVVTACDSFKSENGNSTWYTSGNYFDKIKNAAGCDSIINYSLSIQFASLGSDSISACHKYTTPWDEKISSTGIYSGVITNSFGCDSILTLDVSITDNDPTVSNIGNDTLATKQNYNSYSWLDCGSNYNAINGQNSYKWKPAISGVYAVVVTENDCKDTSECYTFTRTAALSKIHKEDFKILPNPANNFIRINSDIHEFDYEILNNMGQQILIRAASHNKNIDISELSEGRYFVRIIKDKKSSTYPFIVSR